MDASLEPDTEDRTWVLRRPCPECGHDSAAVAPGDLAGALRDNAALWPLALREAEPARRRRPGSWSTLEHAAHVRDVHRVLAARVRLVLERDDPLLASWDQDADAGGYADEDPARVAAQVVDGADEVAGLYESVEAAADRDLLWSRPGRRDDGSRFTLASLGRHHLHEVVHHAWDVREALTVGSYDAGAADYATATAVPSAAVTAAVQAFAAALGAGARVLEVGSGGGRDALALEAAGLVVRRTDVTPAFVDLLRAAGHDADLLDPLHDDLRDPASLDEPAPYDGVWANACLLHVARADLPTVLARLAAVTRDGGRLHLSLKEGDGEGWSTHGSLSSPRRFVRWREEPLRAVLDATGWDVVALSRRDGLRGERWLEVAGARRVVGGA